MSSFMVDPIRKYQINGQVSQLTAVGGGYAVANNTLVLAAVTGKRHRIMGWLTQGVAGISAFALKSASGGTFLMGPVSVTSNATGTPHLLPIEDSGYFETNTSEGLYIDVGGVALNATFFLITYTPV